MRAVVLTHGHEDHVGGLPYLLREVEVEAVVATRLTLGLVKSKLDEHGLGRRAELIEAEPEGRAARARPVPRRVRPRRALDPRLGRARDRDRSRPRPAHGRLEARPHAGRRAQDRRRQARRGREPRRRPPARRLDERRAARLRPGSERLVGEAFRTLFPLRTGRILVASFASNIHRMQQAADVAIECGRKVTVVGRSMRKNLNIARNLGYVELPEDAIVSPERGGAAAAATRCSRSARAARASRCPRSRASRTATIRPSTVEPGDTVIISAKPVPGNELRVHDSINQLARARRRGAARGDRARARLGSRVPGGAADDALAAPSALRDADPRRVPDARRAREARARGGCARRSDRDRRERLGRRARARRRADRRPRRGRA